MIPLSQTNFEVPYQKPRDIEIWFQTLIRIRPLKRGDREWAASKLREHWGSTRIVTRGRIHEADRLPGIVLEDDDRAGLLTYMIEEDRCEIVTLNNFTGRKGVGSTLLAKLEERARTMRCGRLWLITTNDNTDALRFWQKRGFRISAIHLNAMEESRRLKPEIPEIGMNGIPIRDEIELEKILSYDC
jgi:GNAT superfamily N-acetyltransferase